MTSIILMDYLCLRLKELFTGYSLLNKNQVMQEIKIFSQYVPQPESITLSERHTGIKNYGESDYEANFPCIIAKFLSSSDQEENRIDSTLYRVKFLIGIYDDGPECQGWRDILQIQERIKQDFLTYRVLRNKFRLNMPLISRLLEVETWPVYFGEMDLEFESGRWQMPPHFVYRQKKE